MATILPWRRRRFRRRARRLVHHACCRCDAAWRLQCAPADFTCSTAALGMALRRRKPDRHPLHGGSVRSHRIDHFQYTLVRDGVTGSRALLGFSGLAGLCLLLVRGHGRRLPLLPALAVVLAATGRLTGCSGKLPTQNPIFTPAGTYTVQFSDTGGILVRNATTLTVKPKSLGRRTRSPQRRLRNGMRPLDRRHARIHR